MNKIATYYNADCLICGGMDKKMVMIGPMVVCINCLECFDDCMDYETWEYDSSSEIYKEYLERYKKKIEDGLKEEAEEE